MNNLFSAVIAMMSAIFLHIKDFKSVTSEQLKAVASTFTQRFDIADDALELKIEIAVTLIADGYSPARVLVDLVKELLVNLKPVKK